MKIAKLTIFLLLSFSNFLFAQEPGAKRIALKKADFYRVDSKNKDVTKLVGNVTLEHEGTNMDCDSAYIYTKENKFVAFGNVVVTSPGGTIVKGDSIIYNSQTNMANVRGKIAYLIDSTATLRTTAIDFDTKNEIGFFEVDGTIKDSARIIESKQGHYYSKNKDFVFVGEVKVHTTEYIIRSDSLVYNTDTKIFDFYSHTHIWGNNGYLYCNTGWYKSETDQLFFTKDSYILSETQEILADSIYYENVTGDGKLYSNIQIIDTTQKLIALADLAIFNLKSEDFELQKKPAVIMYSEDQDSVFIRGDIIRSINTLKPKEIIEPEVAERPNFANPDEMPYQEPAEQGDSTSTAIYGDASSSMISEHSMSEEIIPSDTALLSNTSEEINSLDSTSTIATYGEEFVNDTTQMDDSLNLYEEVTPLDYSSKSIGNYVTDSVIDQPKGESPSDSTYRQLFVIKNVLSYSLDMQSSCDSLCFNTMDSITKMYKEPIVWSGTQAQITSDSAFTFTKNGDLDRSEFYSNAFIVMPENNTDTSKYHHQIKGRRSIFYFKEREIYKMDVLGNTQSIFYSTADQTANFTESANLTVLFEKKKIRRATYKIKPKTDNLPLHMVTVERSKLDNFAWYGDKRPKTRNDITNRQILEHKVADYKNKKIPEFTITSKFDKLEALSSSFFLY